LRPTRVLTRIGSSASWADTPRPPGAGGETDDRFNPTGRADHRPDTTPYPPDFRQMLRLPLFDSAVPDLRTQAGQVVGQLRRRLPLSHRTASPLGRSRR